MVDRRAAGVPLEHVLGWAEFCGLRIAVDPGVFVPRRRTEFLARQAAALARPRAVVVDLCCGSGAVGAALAAALDRVELYAVDIDPAAVRCARRNLAGAGGQVYEGDLYQPLPATLRGRVDRPHGGTIGDSERVVKLLKAMLDQGGRLPDRYDLEVSSPGAERPGPASEAHAGTHTSEIALPWKV